MPIIRCEHCGTEQSMTIVGDVQPQCNNCENRTLTQVRSEL